VYRFGRCASSTNIVEEAMKPSLPVAALSIALLFAACAPDARAADWRQEYCHGGATCMLLEQNGSTVDMYLRNVFPSDEIVTTMSFRQTAPMENLRTDATFPFTRVIAGTAPVKVLTFTIIDTTKRWAPNVTYYWQYGSIAAKHDAARPYELPFERGKRFRVGQAFNGKITHHGEFAYSVDFLMPIGTPIHAAREGVVIAVEGRYGEGRLEPAYKERNNYVFILHPDGTIGRYVHMVKDGISVKVGQHVKAGDRIATSGNSGYSDSPHLHFDVARVLDERRSTTVPFAFRTDYANAEKPREALWYSFSGDGAHKVRVPVEPSDVRLCRRVVNNEFRECGNEFAAGSKVLVALPLGVPGAYRVKTVMRKTGAPPIVSDFRTHKDWWYTYATAELPGAHSAAGEWIVEVFLDGKKIREIPFRVR